MQGQYSRLTLKDRTDPTFEKVLYEAGPGLPFGALYAPAYAGDGTVAIIGARGMERNLLFIPVDDRPMMQIPREQMPHAMRELQSQKIKGSWTLTFSWANMNMLSRLGFYDVSRHTFRLMDQDVSGGCLHRWCTRHCLLRCTKSLQQRRPYAVKSRLCVWPTPADTACT